MNSMGLAVVGFGMIALSWAQYMSTIPRNKVPVRPVGAGLMQAIGMVLAVVSLGWSLQGGTPLSIALAVFALLFGAAFFWLLSQRRTPIGEIRVEVGDRILPFEAMTDEGAVFHSDELAGKRILLKFFRGGW